MPESLAWMAFIWGSASSIQPPSTLRLTRISGEAAPRCSQISVTAATSATVTPAPRGSVMPMRDIAPCAAP